MTTLTKKRVPHHSTRKVTRHLPRHVSKQLEGIYYQSVKNIKKHPYKATSSVLASIGIGFALYLLVRYFQTK